MNYNQHKEIQKFILILFIIGPIFGIGAGKFVLAQESKADPDFIGGLDFFVNKTQDFDENDLFNYPFFNSSISQESSRFLFEWTQNNENPPAIIINFTLIFFSQVDRFKYEINSDRDSDHYKVITDENKINISGFPSGYNFAVAVFVDVFEYPSSYINIEFEVITPTYRFTVLFLITISLGAMTYIFYRQAFPKVEREDKEVLL